MAPRSSRARTACLALLLGLGSLVPWPLLRGADACGCDHGRCTDGGACHLPSRRLAVPQPPSCPLHAGEPAPVSTCSMRSACGHEHGTAGLGPGFRPSILTRPFLLFAPLAFELSTFDPNRLPASFRPEPPFKPPRLASCF